ncbi:MAG: sugar ABC transporter ATP-binding protein [Verrucomicrobiales bacterium]|nr:sugar ABC transporter ATP-binding protein [Verrucomicrobiales bacterium]MCP5526108.1 sugar ABC transporter ATP-binding protein [Verrucomicrobiales bacterium]
MRGLAKAFPGVQALQDVGLEVFPGEVHALMGENGAGKSTLMSIIAGLQPPDAGELQLDGRPVTIPNPHAALRLGIGMIHQELLPFRALSVEENLFMGQQPTRGFPGWIDRRALRRRARQLLDRLGATFPPTARMGSLSVAQMQTVEIAKALAHRVRLLIMDEPTSAISEREVEALFRIIGELRAEGVAIIYISHRMDEVFRIADRITVLRDGRHIETRPAAAFDEPGLVRLMVGRELDAAAPRAPTVAGEPMIEVDGLSLPGRFADLAFAVNRGEVLGLAGLMGAGRTEVLNALYGLVPATRGRIRIEGREVRIRQPADALRHGIALVTEDRKVSGLVPQLSVEQNLTLASLRRCCRGPWILRAGESRLAEDAVATFGIRASNRNQRVNQLSGGNQQKVVVAKALLTRPKVLLLDEPTRGIDVGAKAELYTLIDRLAREGMAIVLVSSELPELMRLSDRLLVLCEGRITAELDPRRTTQEAILHHAMPAAAAA